eukprot:TRINITY_DN25530_c0_g1_i1.p2 TRINITY_DN25530_c0_g1~~TRINITY_DN25530_c0_g1_i1.p2  ORF type:complete len:180 (+),score=56.06 TRINITY_DN25530_c0_g1_i1:53-592(+)
MEGRLDDPDEWEANALRVLAAKQQGELKAMKARIKRDGRAKAQGLRTQLMVEDARKNLEDIIHEGRDAVQESIDVKTSRSEAITKRKEECAKETNEKIFQRRKVVHQQRQDKQKRLTAAHSRILQLEHGITPKTRPHTIRPSAYSSLTTAPDPSITTIAAQLVDIDPLATSPPRSAKWR